jgi:hypothetical protein
MAMTADHPNAVWLADMYGTGMAIANDASLDNEAKAAKAAAHAADAAKRMSPEILIHTGGVRLAATGGYDFLQAYARRRGSLSKGNVGVAEIYQVLADDHYAIIYARFRSERDGEVWERPGLGAWRFQDGLAVEHWELPDGRAWDEYYLSADDSLIEGNAAEYWTRAV